MKYLFPKGKTNPNWNGGKTIGSNGYIKVLVGIGHHLADSKGYAYEHRVMAEQLLGRRLKPKEQIHHRNGIITDNRPENLEIHPSRGHHHVKHRTRSDLKHPDEQNPITICACGCGNSFLKFDKSNRPRRFISGHNRHPVHHV